MGSPSTGGRTGGGILMNRWKRGILTNGILTNGWKRGVLIKEWRRGIPWGDPSLVEECDLQLQEMVLCSSEMEMKSKISIIIKTGFRPLKTVQRGHYLIARM